MHFIKHNWFGILAGTLILYGFAVFLIVLFSPRQDNQRRGFIPCTEQMAVDLLECKQEVSCSLKAIMQNSLCDMKVIFSGIKLWMSGTQSTPWANYFFVPELSPQAELPQEVEEFYKENPHIYQEMQKLKALNRQLEDSIAASTLKSTEVPQPVETSEEQTPQEDKDDTKK